MMPNKEQHHTEAQWLLSLVVWALQEEWAVSQGCQAACLLETRGCTMHRKTELPERLCWQKLRGNEFGSG